MSIFNRFHELADKYEMLVSVDPMEIEAAKGRTHMRALKVSPGGDDAEWFIYGDVDMYIEARNKKDGTFNVRCSLYFDSPNLDRLKSSQNPLMKRLLDSIDKKINFGEVSVKSIDEVLGLFEERLKYQK